MRKCLCRCNICFTNFLRNQLQRHEASLIADYRIQRSSPGPRSEDNGMLDVLHWLWEMLLRREYVSTIIGLVPLWNVSSTWSWTSNSSQGFVAFDTFKSLLQDENGKISGPRTVIAGFGAGFTESLLAVTPFESIKTQLFVNLRFAFLCLIIGSVWAFFWHGFHFFPGFNRIDDRKSGKARMRGFLHGSKIIAQEKGIRGFFQGLVPTTARQAANSATRFSSYTTLKQFAQGYVAPGEKLGTLSTFAIGGLAGLITV